MENDLRLSVIIPTHETRELTLRCLAALSLCDPRPHEVIVVDNGSADDTARSVSRKYPMHIVVQLPENEGFSAAVNHGVARASGDLLLPLNSDTEIEAPALGVACEAFARNPRLGILGAALRDFDGTPQWSGGKRPTFLWYFGVASGIPALLRGVRPWRRLRSPSGSKGGTVDWVAGTAMVIRRAVWDVVGPFDLGYRFYCQDIDLCFSAVEAGWGIEILPDFKVFHHRGATIAGEAGAVDRLHPDYLWTDLLRFAGKCCGPVASRNTYLALRLGGWLRVFGRRMVSPFVPIDGKAQWGETNTAYVAAQRALDRARRADLDVIQGP